MSWFIPKSVVLRTSDLPLIKAFERVVELLRLSPLHTSDAVLIAENGNLTVLDGAIAATERYLLEHLPRALWMFSKAKLIPLDEISVLNKIRVSGVPLEPEYKDPRRVAKVQHIDVTKSKALLLFHLNSKSSTRPLPVEQAKTFVLDDEE